MYQVLISILAFLVAISVLVAVHEFGHFWVARRFGIKVLRFSIGFGRPLYRWYDRLGTEYVLSAIPLGGYVSLFGERGTAPIPPTERQWAFSCKPVWVRMLVLAAGPLFNLLLAIFVYWLVFLMGVTQYVPILGAVPKESVAGLAGLQRGEEIVAIDGKSTPSWEAVSTQLVGQMGEDNTLVVTVRRGSEGALENKTLDLGHLAGGTPDPDWIENLGLVAADPAPAVIGTVLPDLPAFKAGLQAGDRIVSADGVEIVSRSDIIQYIQARPHKKIALEILRNGHKLKIILEPMAKQPEAEHKENKEPTEIGFVGVEFPPLKEIPKEYLRTQRFGVGEAFGMAVARSMEYSVLTLQMLKKMIVGKVSVRHISGPLMIAEYAGKSARMGFGKFLDFLGMISISLFVLNLLPIPILDGGHLMYCVYEVVTGRRVSEMAQMTGTWVGGFILVGLMILAIYNDLSHLLGG